MKSSLTSGHLQLLATHYGTSVAASASEDLPASLLSRVPATWLDVVTQPNASTIQALWTAASADLPRFIDYLARSIEGAGLVEMHGFPALVIALPDWDEENCELGPGFCVMGTPTAPQLISQFCDQAGDIPASLRQLWTVANFITLKEHSVLCSLDGSTRGLTEAPAVLPALAGDDVPDGVADCLQIAVINDQMVTCMIRPLGHTHWKDQLVLRYRRTDQISTPLRRRLDDKLADWTFTKWEA